MCRLQEKAPSEESSPLAVAFEKFSFVLLTPASIPGVGAQLHHSLVEIALLTRIITNALDVEGAGDEGKSDRRDNGNAFQNFLHESETLSSLITVNHFWYSSSARMVTSRDSEAA